MEEDLHVYIVGGIAFYDMESAKIAQAELKRISGLDARMDYSDVDSIAAVYEKARKNHIFKTPIGISYMMRLQNCLVQSHYPGIAQMPIPVDTAYGEEELQEQEDAQQGLGSEIWKSRLDSSKEELRQQKVKYRISVGLNLFLAALVAALFIISQTGQNPTVMNYKSNLLNQYTQWQQQLEQREQAIEEREAQLGIE